MMSLHVLIVYIILSTSFLLTCNAVEDTTINRAPKDIFRIPSAMCQNDKIDQQCNNMGAKKETTFGNNVACTCQCKFNTNNVFGWFDNQWKCERNSVARNYNLAGCPLKTFGKTVNSSLLTVQPYNTNKRKIGEITSVANIQYYLQKMFYLDCTSTWHRLFHADYFELAYTPIPNRYALYIKSKTYIGNEQNIYGHVIKLEITCQDELNDDVNFCVVFKVQGQQKCPVVYPTTSTPTTAAEPSTSSKAPTTTFPTTQARPTTEKQITTMSTTQVSTTDSITSNPLFPTKQDTTETTTRDPKLTNKTDQPQKQNRGSTDTDDDSGIIAGAIGGVAVLVAVLVILVVIWFKRKRNSPNKRTAANETVENPVYDGVIRDNSSERPGQQTSTDDEYSYAYTNTHPVVIRDQHAFQVNHKATTGSPSSSESPIYNTLEDPDYANLSKTKDTNSGSTYNVLERRPEANWNTKHSASGSSPNSEAPVYNTLEDPDYANLSKTKDTNSGSTYNVLERRPNANWNKQKGRPLYDVIEKKHSASGFSPNSEAPIYNTLEDPDYANLGQSHEVRIGSSYDILEGPEDKRAMTQGSPFYDVLENPDSTSSPVYDVLEEPESDEQHVYGSLQNNDPHIYGALQSPTSHNEEANSGYDDDYNFAGDVIHYDGDGDVYQET